MMFKKKRKGFTLVELLVGIALTGIVLVVAIQLSQNVLKNYKRTTERLSESTEMQMALNWVAEDLESAVSGIETELDENENTKRLEFSVKGKKDIVGVCYLFLEKENRSELHRIEGGAVKTGPDTLLTRSLRSFKTKVKHTGKETREVASVEISMESGKVVLSKEVTIMKQLL